MGRGKKKGREKGSVVSWQSRWDISVATGTPYHPPLTTHRWPPRSFPNRRRHRIPPRARRCSTTTSSSRLRHRHRHRPWPRPRQWRRRRRPPSLPPWRPRRRRRTGASGRGGGGAETSAGRRRRGIGNGPGGGAVPRLRWRRGCRGRRTVGRLRLRLRLRLREGVGAGRCGARGQCDVCAMGTERGLCLYRRGADGAEGMCVCRSASRRGKRGALWGTRRVCKICLFVIYLASRRPNVGIRNSIIRTEDGEGERSAWGSQGKDARRALHSATLHTVHDA